MLAAMRNTVTGILAKSLMMFLVITFGVWGIGDVVRSTSSSNALVSVGDGDITTQEFARALQDAQRQSGNAIPPEVLNSPMMRQNILQRLVEDRLTSLSTKDLGIAAGTDLIIKRTKENLAFQNVDGTFNAKAFESYLKGTGQSESGYRQQVSKEVARALYADSVKLDQVRLPNSYLTLKSLSLAEQRSAKLITVAANDVGAIDDAELKRFYDQNKDELYMQPETRTLRIATIDKSSIEALIKDDKSGQAFEDLGYAVDDAVAAGQSMEDALKSAKLEATTRTLEKADSESGKGELERAAVEQGFTLNEGESSGLLSAPDGTYYMVNVVNVTSASPKAFDVVKADITKRYREEKGAELAKEKATELKIALNGEKDIAAQVALAQSKGAQVKESGLLQRPEIATTKEVPEALQRGIFNASKGDVVGPVITQNGSYVLAIVSQIDVPKTAKEPDAATQTALKNELGGQVYNLLFTNLVKQYPVKQVGSLPESSPQ